jgi:hypothetical protein
MNHLPLVVGLSAVAVGLARLDAAEPAKPPVVSLSKPNIVFIYADDWGWGDPAADFPGVKEGKCQKPKIAELDAPT